MDTAQMLKEIATQVLACQKCVLKNTRKRAVPGNGPATARVMLIGEGPGFHENEQGLPFVGAAGKFLDELLKGGGLSREEVFITNVVKCRPPGNRDPLPDELSACNDYLDRQIDIINPMVIVTLGRYSMGKFLPNVKISAVHGRSSWVNGRLVIPMYHPAAALHQPQLKPTLVKEFSQLSKWIERAREKARPEPVLKEIPDPVEKEEPKQLNLF